MDDFAAFFEKAEKHLDNYAFSPELGIGYAILAHAKAMEDVARALELHAKMQSRPSM